MHTGKRPRNVFYGWWIVTACFIIMLFTGGTVFFGFTAVLEPLANEFGWSYAQISLAASLRGLEMGLFAPLLGMVVDRWGPRRLIFAGTICVGLGLILLSYVSSLGMFYGVFILMSLGMSALSGTVMLTAVANWFREKVATATGIVVSGFAVGGILVPIVTVLIDKYEWRTAMIILGLCVWVIALPLSLMVRHRPEQYGYLPDGKLDNHAFPDKQAISVQTSVEDIPSGGTGIPRAFWHIALSSLCHMLIISAVITHVMPYLASIGVSRAISSLAAGALPLASAGGRLGFGWLGDRVDKIKMAVMCFALMALGLLCFSFLSIGWMWLLVPFIIIFSTGWGGGVTMRAAMLREHFSRSRFGRMFGFVTGIAMFGHVAGAPIAGWAFDKWGTYHEIWFVLAGLSVAGLVVIQTIPRLQSKTRLNDNSHA